MGTVNTQEPRTVRVVLADDHPMMRHGLRVILNSSPQLEVVAVAANGQELLSLVATWHPDVAVVDLEMPEVDGVEAIRRIRDQHPQVACLVLTAHEEPAYLRRAVVAGANGYLSKNDAPDVLVDGVLAVSTGQAALDPSVTDYLVHQLAEPSDNDGDVAADMTLSQRELDVLGRLAAGRTTGQIAADLGIGVQTVKSHIGHIYTKTGHGDRATLVAAALRQGLVY